MMAAVEAGSDLVNAIYWESEGDLAGPEEGRREEARHPVSQTQRLSPHRPLGRLKADISDISQPSPSWLFF